MSGTDWGRVDASEALLKGVKGIFSVKAFDMAGTDAERGAAPPLNMDAFSFELYMQRRSLPPLEDSVSHSRLEQERARTTKVTASDRNGEGKVTYSEALLDERYEPWGPGGRAELHLRFVEQVCTAREEARERGRQGCRRYAVTRDCLLCATRGARH